MIVPSFLFGVIHSINSVGLLKYCYLSNHDFNLFNDVHVYMSNK